MAIKEIVQEGDPVLRKTAEAVAPEEFNSKELTELIQNMQDTLDACDDGVGLAAPQIGISKRVFIISKKAWGVSENETATNLVCINPTIEKLSKSSSLLEEGCLSVRGLFGYVERADKARIRAYNQDGKPFTYNGSGLVAEIFQHEVDHLSGILYLDHTDTTHKANHEHKH
ncbi:MAG: peptide deformylase [bacterium]|nr:peptide deformylase [bacterium]